MNRDTLLEETQAIDVESSENEVQAEYDLYSKIRKVAEDYRVLANSFMHTGNKIVAERLFDSADVLGVVVDKLIKLSSRIQSDRLRDAQQATHNMINVALAIGTRKADLGG